MTAAKKTSSYNQWDLRNIADLLKTIEESDIHVAEAVAEIDDSKVIITYNDTEGVHEATFL